MQKEIDKNAARRIFEPYHHHLLVLRPDDPLSRCNSLLKLTPQTPRQRPCATIVTNTPNSRMFYRSSSQTVADSHVGWLLHRPYEYCSKACGATARASGNIHSTGRAPTTMCKVRTSSVLLIRVIDSSSAMRTKASPQGSPILWQELCKHLAGGARSQSTTIWVSIVITDDATPADISS